MKRHFGQTKAQRQADYMATFAETLLARFPRLAGRMSVPADDIHYGEIIYEQLQNL